MYYLFMLPSNCGAKPTILVLDMNSQDELLVQADHQVYHAEY